MRLCIVSSSFYPATAFGGPTYATWILSRQLSKKGVKVYVTTTNSNLTSKIDTVVNSFIKKQENLFVKYYNEQILNKFSLKFILGIWSDIKSADVIYIQYLFHYTVFISLLVSFLLKKKVILCPRGCFNQVSFDYKYKWIKRFWIQFLIKPFAKNVIWHACSYLETKDIKSFFKEARVVEINDGIDFNEFQNSEKFSKTELFNKFSEVKSSFVSDLFFSMGRLHKIKRFDVIIDSFYLYLKDNPNAKLIIAGNNDGDQDYLVVKINELGLTDYVLLIGQIGLKDKCILLSNASVFLLASDFESFGIVVIEALASGTPVIVSNKTPWKGINKNKCGIFTDNNSVSFYEAMEELKNQEFNTSMIKSYALKKFDIKIIANKFIELLAE